MHRKLPAGRPAHRETRHHHPILVDGILLLHRIEHLKQIDLAGELVCIAISAIEIDDKLIARGGLAAGDKLGLHQILAAAMTEKVEPEFAVGPWLITLRHSHHIGLNRTVYPGDIPARAAFAHPWRFAL